MSAARRALALGAVAGAAVLGGCGGQQSPLAPKSGPSREIADLFWGMLAAAGVVFAGTVLLLVLAWRRREKGLPFFGEREGAANGLVIGFGIVIPVAALVTLFAVANLNVLRDTDAPRAATTRLTVEVIGRQWFWDVRYPGTRAVTANEIHIPARTRVNVVAETADVIHSFWVPELNRKVDMIPGKRNRILLYAEHPGRFRGQCAEFCGLQHANMSLYVFADPPARFRAWLAGQQRNAPAASGGAVRHGQQVFMSHACADCHTISGTPARGTVGPDLSHVAGRSTLAALTLPNRPGRLADWIRDPQHYKPGNKMPGIRLSPAELRDLVAYLETLR